MRTNLPRTAHSGPTERATTKTPAVILTLMKPLTIAWMASALWAAFCLYQAVQMFQTGWNHEADILEWGEKLKSYLAGVGTLTIGGIPLYVTSLWQRFHRSRERARLLKEKHRIEVRLQKLDEATARAQDSASETSAETKV